METKKNYPSTELWVTDSVTRNPKTSYWAHCLVRYKKTGEIQERLCVVVKPSLFEFLNKESDVPLFDRLGFLGNGADCDVISWNYQDYFDTL